MKVCTACREAKPATLEFFVKKLGGLSSRCKPCGQAVKRAAWARDAEQINAQRRGNRTEADRERDRVRYRADPNGRNSHKQRWREQNPEEAKQRDRDQYVKTAERRKRQAKEWSARNPERNRENMRNFFRRKRATDPMYRLRSAVSAYVYWCLKNGKNGRRHEDVLGYTIDQLRSHLEAQFVKGMSWDNYGEWHVDHILPVSSFTFTIPDDADFKACWAMTNLQPLWAGDNIAKAGKRLHLI